MNPFKFGSVVDGEHFTNRIAEIARINSVLESKNHLIIISPRRFGKTSLILKTVRKMDRPVIYLDMQLMTSTNDFAAQLLKKVHKLYPYKKFQQFLKNFKITPAITLNVQTNNINITFHPQSAPEVVIEDVLRLLEDISSDDNKLIVIIDEFQEIKRLDTWLEQKLRAIIQHHKKVNFVFLGSKESMMREIFEKKKSPFYNFGFLMPIGEIPKEEFMEFLTSRFIEITDNAPAISEEIIKITNSHPYYTQCLAFSVWEVISKQRGNEAPVQTAIAEMVKIHDNDFERLWTTLTKTEQKIMLGLVEGDLLPLSEAFRQRYELGANSTTFSALKKLEEKGMVIKLDSKYEIDDPIFSKWLIGRRVGEW
ncbi:ATP-binding protein [Ignavibacteriales bacterium]